MVAYRVGAYGNLGFEGNAGLMVTGAVTVCLSRTLAGCTLLAGTYEQSRSETLPAHLGIVLGSRDPGQMGIMT